MNKIEMINGTARITENTADKIRVDGKLKESVS